MDRYLGNQSPLISPDGNFLMLIGRKSVGPRISTRLDPKKENGPIYIETLKNEKPFKTISHFDIYSNSVKKILDKNDIPTLGEGWSSLRNLVKN